jgi:hypothetical protein
VVTMLISIVFCLRWLSRWTCKFAEEGKKKGLIEIGSRRQI